MIKRFLVDLKDKVRENQIMSNSKKEKKRDCNALVIITQTMFSRNQEHGPCLNACDIKC